MNRVYNVREKTDNIYYAVGGENRSKAIINYLQETGENTFDFIHYRARLARTTEGKPIFTESTGLLDMEELMPKGYPAWWDCPECGNASKFEYMPIDRYKCCECGYEGNIPFAD